MIYLTDYKVLDISAIFVYYLTIVTCQWGLCEDVSHLVPKSEYSRRFLYVLIRTLFYSLLGGVPGYISRAFSFYCNT